MKEALTKLYQATLDANPHLRGIFECLSRKLGMGADDILHGLFRYDDEIGTYDNTVYDDIKVRSALFLKYFVNGSYHVERQNVLTSFLNNAGQIQDIVDIGYGAPGLYVEKYVLGKPDMRLSLLDKYESAERFSRALLECAYPDTDWEKQIRFQAFDLDEMKSPGTFDAYILFDSIEHSKDPTGSMDAIVKDSPEHAQFFLSMPICSKDGIEDLHFIEWLTEDDAKNWLRERGLKIEEQRKVVPTAVDSWADGFSFYNLIVRCTKR